MTIKEIGQAELGPFCDREDPDNVRWLEWGGKRILTACGLLRSLFDRRLPSAYNDNGFPGSSNGRTTAFGAVDSGSSPDPGAKPHSALGVSPSGSTPSAESHLLTNDTMCGIILLAMEAQWTTMPW